METEFEEIASCRFRLKMHIGKDDLRKAKADVARDIQKRINIPGFRPRRAPLDLIIARFRDEVTGQALEDVADEVLRRELKERGLKVSTDVTRDIEGPAEDGSYEVTVEFEALPKVELQEYLGLEVEEPELPAITEQDVLDEIEEFRESAATFEPAGDDYQAHEGDKVSGDLTIHEAAESEGSEESSRAFRNVQVVAGLGAFVTPDFPRELVGVRKGDSVEHVGPLIEEHETRLREDMEAGSAFFELPQMEEVEPSKRNVRLHFDVRQTLQKHKPPLDDELAKKYGNVETLDEWKQVIRERLEKVREEKLEELRTEAILDELLARNPVTIGEETVQRFLETSSMAAVDEVFVVSNDVKQKIAERLREGDFFQETARRKLEVSILLAAIADEEGLEVGDEELDQRIKKIAESMDTNPERVRGLLGEKGLERLRARMLNEKALDLVKRYVVMRPKSRLVRQEDVSVTEKPSQGIAGPEEVRP